MIFSTIAPTATPQGIGAVKIEDIRSVRDGEIHIRYTVGDQTLDVAYVLNIQDPGWVLIQLTDYDPNPGQHVYILKDKRLSGLVGKGLLNAYFINQFTGEVIALKRFIHAPIN